AQQQAPEQVDGLLARPCRAGPGREPASMLQAAGPPAGSRRRPAGPARSPAAKPPSALAGPSRPPLAGPSRRRRTPATGRFGKAGHTDGAWRPPAEPAARGFRMADSMIDYIGRINLQPEHLLFCFS